MSYLEETKMDSHRLNMTLPQYPTQTSRSIIPKHDTSFAFLRCNKVLIQFKKS